MSNLIERYIYDVTRRLPEKERDDVIKELNSNIYDMLPDNASEEEIKALLNEFGAPAILAEKYRQKPRYVISPAIFDDYIRALKWILPLVGGILFLIGIITEIMDVVQSEPISITALITSMLTNGFSMGISGAFQAFIWVTIGFTIAEWKGYKTNSRTVDWKVEDLPDMPPNDKSRIPLSDSITGLIVSTIFGVIGILYCSGLLPIHFIIDRTGGLQLFSSSFLAACIPAIIILTIIEVGKNIVKITTRRWTMATCIAVVLNSLVSMTILLYLLNRTDLFSQEFIAFAHNSEWSMLHQLQITNNIMDSSILVIIAVTIVVVSLIECATSVYRTTRTALAKK